MANKQELIKEVAQNFGWSQADVKRALEEYGDFETKEEIMACCLHYSGSELKKRNYSLGALKRANDKQKQAIKELIDKVTAIPNFYQNEVIPNLRGVIDAQAERITELLKQMPWASGGDK
jgi:dsDNA-specific endonuclease/ATPase MutS2